ncbi:MAG: zf-HC2 domain-containing protein [Bacteroidota bacterium]|nr:zf-HC2 domain-containing protein [Bacteroidota bacterium]
MNCQTTKEQISQLLDNELRAEELQPMFQHLSECEECRKFFLQTKDIHDSAKTLEYITAPKVIDQKFAVLGMEQQQSFLSRKFTISVPSAIYSIGAVIVLMLFIYVSGTIQEKQIAEQYRQTMSLTMPYGASSYDRN